MHLKLLSTLFVAASLSGCIVHVGGDYRDKPGSSVSTVLGGIDIDEGHSVGDLSTVNGGIELASNVIARDVDTVNGGIEMGDNVTIEDASVVNGDIEAGTNLHVNGDVTTVNGDVNFESGANIKGNIETVNGDIQLTGATVGRDITTHNGDIELADATVVKGNIIWEKRDDDSWLRNDNIPRLRISADSVVEGEIMLYREVELILENASLNDKVRRLYSDE
ncbi:DUF4097 family beta strand repeat-containing protein [Alteromonas ponticola]|uniref:DUF4097 family beta strand repeat protein n=1 Tax=Alteromonas ponticola TaxID=2720613 RepID=A0ABX1R070_9ALTE|nr:DUF4097 family beta strand repeat-containing protein [Alteromonas ponticola]NMH58857.1 DUF4097 family beta strand repeat protein [Alteromonas ponticola]